MWKLGLVVAVFGACSSSSTSPGSVSGTIQSKSYVVADSIALVGDGGVEIALSSGANACTSTVQHPGETALLLLLYGTAAGTYMVTDTQGSNGAVAEANVLDASCVNVADNDVLATAGTINLTTASGGVFAGTFDLTFGADHVTGSFDATQCASKPTPTTCTP
jgi:hypothetical protein